MSSINPNNQPPSSSQHQSNAISVHTITATTTSISQTSFIDFASPSISAQATPQPPSTPCSALPNLNRPDSQLPASTSCASLSGESIDAPISFPYNRNSVALSVSGCTSGRPSAIKLDSQADKQSHQPHSPAKTISPEPNIIRPPDAFRSAVDSSNQHIMHETGYNAGAPSAATSRQMFQDGYHPQRHGMGPLSDSEFAFSNLKRMHRKRSLIGFDSSLANVVEDPALCALLLTVISVILIFITLPFSLFFCIKVVQEYERAVIFRLGRLVTGGARGPGIFFIIPCIDTYSKVDLRTVSFDVPPQEILSKDSVTVAVDAVVYFRISNAIASVSNVEDYARSTRLLAATTLRNVLGTKNLSEILSERESISHMIQTSLDEATDSWGVKVERVEIKDVRLPVLLQRAMAAEAEAAREARAKVIAAEGEQRASRALREASEVISDSPAALQLRYLQTLNSIAAEKNSTIIFPVPMELFRGIHLPSLPGSSSNSATTSSSASSGSSSTASPNANPNNANHLLNRSSRSSSCDMSKQRHQSSSEPNSASGHFPPPPPPGDCDHGCDLNDCSLNGCELSNCGNPINNCSLGNCAPSNLSNLTNGTGNSLLSSSQNQTVVLTGRRISRGERCQPTAAMLYDLTANSSSCSSSAANLLPLNTTSGSSLVSTHCPLLNGSNVNTTLEPLDSLNDCCRIEPNSIGTRDTRLSNGSVGGVRPNSYRRPSNRYEDHDDHSFGNELNAYESRGNSEDEVEDDDTQEDDDRVVPIDCEPIKNNRHTFN